MKTDETLVTEIWSDEDKITFKYKIETQRSNLSTIPKALTVH